MKARYNLQSGANKERARADVLFQVMQRGGDLRDSTGKRAEERSTAIHEQEQRYHSHPVHMTPTNSKTFKRHSLGLNWG